MLNRKAIKAANGAANHSRAGAAKARTNRRRFIISPKAQSIISPKAQSHPAKAQSHPAKVQTPPAKAQSHAQPHPVPPAKDVRNGQNHATPITKADAATQAKAAYASRHEAAPAGAPSQAVDLTDTIKTLMHLAHEHGHVTYDDINDILPDGLSPDDLDELYTKLRSMDIEIV